jgi:hypothetical protein
MMEYNFITTYRGSRGLGANIISLSFESVVKKLKEKKTVWSSNIRIAKLDHGYDMMKFLDVKTFEELKLNELLTAEDVENNFNLEIRKRYGIMKDRVKLKRIPKKELEVGRLYELENGDSEYYLGRVKYDGFEKSFSRYAGDKKLSGEGFLTMRSFYTDLKRRYGCENMSFGIYTLKNPRKYVKALDKRVEVERIFKDSDENGSYINIEFLDVKGENDG